LEILKLTKYLSGKPHRNRNHTEKFTGFRVLMGYGKKIMQIRTYFLSFTALHPSV
jgi:hypothetical protein